MDNLSPDTKTKFISLQKDGKMLASKGFLEDSLAAFKQAYAICATEKILSRMKKLEDLLTATADEGEEMMEVANGFYVHKDIYDKLYKYQKEGVAWMWTLYKAGKGGVLGDDMGLGKTFQVIAFLSGMIDADLIRNVLIIMPVSLIPNWQNEFKKWCPGMVVYEFHANSKKKRMQDLNYVQRRGGVIITSYGMVVSNYEAISNLDGHRFVWDYVILDEGHRIKNPTKATKAVHEIASKNRLVITGTPIQNNLRELWALYDFAHHGTLLGTQKTFKMQYETPITRAREKDSTAGERKLGSVIAQSLKELIKPYFLRRTKEEVFEKKESRHNSSAVDELGDQLGNLKLTALPKRNDFVVWVIVHQPQYELYTSFLKSDAVKKILMSTKSPLVELTVLKKICDHPRLLSGRACMQLGLDGSMDEEELLNSAECETATASSISRVSDETLINESGKMSFTVELLENLRATGHRTLVFSLSRKILDMIQRIMTNRGWKVLRIDGTINKMEERHKRIRLFQTDKSWPLFLLTTQVGGVGITLTAADRVIIYDPSWNPATDAQAVDRVFRIGQDKEVIVYRLITCGTIEEKIYRRQVFKDSVTRQAVGTLNDPHRYFSKQELKELFTVDDIHYSSTQIQLEAMHSTERKTSASLDEHIKFLHSLNIFGISDHDLLFSKEVKNPQEDNSEASVSHEYIKKRVELAELLVQREASVFEEGMRISGSYIKPYTLTLPSSCKKTTPDLYQPPQFPEVIELGRLKYSSSGSSSSSPKKANKNETSISKISSFKTGVPSNSYISTKTAVDVIGKPDKDDSVEVLECVQTKYSSLNDSKSERKKDSFAKSEQPSIANGVKELNGTTVKDCNSTKLKGNSHTDLQKHDRTSSTPLLDKNSVFSSNVSNPVYEKVLSWMTADDKSNGLGKGSSLSDEKNDVDNISNNFSDLDLSYNASNSKPARQSRRKSCVVKRNSVILSRSESSSSSDAGSEILISDSDTEESRNEEISFSERSICESPLLMNKSKGFVSSTPLSERAATLNEASKELDLVQQNGNKDFSFCTSPKLLPSIQSSPMQQKVNALKNFPVPANMKNKELEVSEHSTSGAVPLRGLGNSHSESVNVENKQHNQVQQNIIETSFCASPKTVSGIHLTPVQQKISNLGKSMECEVHPSPRRITPLQIFNREPTPQELSFQRAANNSVQRRHEVANDSPLQLVKRRGARVIASDSDDSPDKNRTHSINVTANSGKSVSEPVLNTNVGVSPWVGTRQKRVTTPDSESNSDEDLAKGKLQTSSAEGKALKSDLGKQYEEVNSDSHSNENDLSHDDRSGSLHTSEGNLSRDNEGSLSLAGDLSRDSECSLSLAGDLSHSSDSDLSRTSESGSSYTDESSSSHLSDSDRSYKKE